MRVTVLALPDQVWNSLAANEEYHLGEMTVRHTTLTVRQHEKKRGGKYTTLTVRQHEQKRGGK